MTDLPHFAFPFTRPALGGYIGPYDPTRAYKAGDVVSYQGDLYKANAPIAPTNLVTNPSSEVSQGMGSASSSTTLPTNLVPKPSFEDLAVGAAPAAANWAATSSGGNTPNIVPNPSGETTPTVVSVSAVSSAPNVITNPSAETGTTNWSPRSQNTVVASTDQAKAGTQSFKLTRNVDAAGPQSIYITAGTGMRPAVSPGQFVAATCSVRAAAIARGASITLLWEDASGVQQGTLQAGTVVTDSASGWTDMTLITAAAPAGTTRFQLRLNFNAVDEGEVHYIDAICACVFAAAPTNPPNYFDGSMAGFAWTGTAHASTSQANATAIADSTAWAKAGTHSSRVTIVRDDAASLILGRTATGTSGIAVTPNNWFVARVSIRSVSMTSGVLSTARCGIYWWTAAGAAASTASGSGPSVSLAVGGTTDAYVILQAPADAAFASVAAVSGMSIGAAGNVVVAEMDAFMLHEFGATWTGSQGASTNPAEVPPYADGTMTGFRWIGTAHNSSTGVQTMASLADNNWTRPYGTKSIHYTVTRTDGAVVAAGTGGGAGLQANMFPVVAGHTYGCRIALRHRTPTGILPPPGNARLRIYWFDASGVACTPAVTDGTGSTIGVGPFPLAIDLSLQATASPNAAYARIVVYFQNPNNNSAATPGLWYQVDADLDHFMCVDMNQNANTYTKIPDYNDGSMPGYKWSGTAEASTTLPMSAARTRVANDWGGPGSWASRLQITRDDGAQVTIRTGSGTDQASNGRFAIDWTHYYAFRARVRWRSGDASGLWANVFPFTDNTGSTQAESSQSGPSIANPVNGAVYDLTAIVKFTSPTSANVEVRVLADNPNYYPNAIDFDVDGIALYDLGPNFAGPTGTSTNPADVPAYFDGSTSGYRWTGTAHASTSVPLTPDLQTSLWTVNPGTKVNVVEQRSPDHITSQQLAVVVTPMGFREDRPDFGWEWPEFRNIPLDLSSLADAFERLVPDADVKIEEFADAADAAIRRVQVSQVLSGEGVAYSDESTSGYGGATPQGGN